MYGTACSSIWMNNKIIVSFKQRYKIMDSATPIKVINFWGRNNVQKEGLRRTQIQLNSESTISKIIKLWWRFTLKIMTRRLVHLIICGILCRKEKGNYNNKNHSIN